jgi:asparagine synthase (glutamine-hydrolysing)
MCGICGEYRLDGHLPSLQTVQAMMEKLEKRGPDHAGTFSDGALAFGHRRLSILDLSEKGNQPMIDPQLSLALVFNGTIYNHPELRKTLQSKGHTFFSTGDTEVILKAYAEWGRDCVKRFLGMFAIAIWDLKEKTLFLARDRMGIKPLYYSQSQQGFRFASNVQALLATGDIDTRIDPIALHHQFTLHAVVPAPRTILQGIRKLEPAHSVLITAKGEQQRECYWTLDATSPEKELSDREWTDAIHESLKTAVRRRNAVSDVPVGVLLSGGLDSSLLVGLLDEIGIEDIRTFTIGFDDQPEEKGSEYEFSDAVVKHFNTHHTKVHIPNEDTLLRLPEAVANMSEPMFGQDAIGFYLLSEQVAKEVKVVQSGQGADEVFGGYFWYSKMREATGTPLERFRQFYFDRDHDEMTAMLMPDYIGRDYSAETMSALLEAPQADSFIDQVLRADTTLLIVDDPVKRVDNMTMAWGLEARVPFLDHELVELAAKMPPEMKLRDNGKYVLKQIARGLIPDRVIDRKKGYFPVPALKFVRGEFLDFMRDIVNSQACRERGIYQRTYVDKLLQKPEDYLTRIQGSKLWHMALLEYWLQTNGI